MMEGRWELAYIPMRMSARYLREERIRGIPFARTFMIAP
jgi:hypothetical protein